MDNWELAGRITPPLFPLPPTHLLQLIRGMVKILAFERAAYAAKSFVIALALCRGRLTAHEAAEASHVEVRSQIEQWGEVEDSE